MAKWISQWKNNKTGQFCSIIYMSDKTYRTCGRRFTSNKEAEKQLLLDRKDV